MESPILKQIVKFLQTRKKQKQWMVVFVFMAVIVGVGTVTALKMMGQAMTRKEHVLDCQLQVHQHTKDCYDGNNNLVCGYADYVVHKHNDDCYNSEGKLVCRLPEVEKHEHTKKCYEKTKTLVCGQEESAGHEHTDGCYATQKGALDCKKEEHQHNDGCYDEEGNLVCGMEEHQHNDDCYKYEDVLTCKIKEGEGGHKHTDKCYDVQEVLTCGKLEMHKHTDKCFEKIDKNGKDEPENLKLVCGKTELLEHTHTEDAGCLRTVDAAEADVIQAELDKEAEEAALDKAAEEGREIFTTDMNEEEENGEDAATAEGEEGEAAEGEDAANPEGEAAEGEEGTVADEAEPETYEETKTYEGLGYIVTASYNKDANIPEEAKFVAERITKESDEEDYKKHEEEYKKSVGNENATMSALFKIGFYVDGEEVEPATPVAITVQFVDKNGLPEGAPIKVVHFGDDKTEVIKGSKAESGSTSFKTDSFSKFAIGSEETDETDAEKASVHISDSYQYENEVFHITFHVEGDAVKTDGKGEGEKSEEEFGEDTVTEDGSEEGSGEDAVTEAESEEEFGEDTVTEDGSEEGSGEDAVTEDAAKGEGLEFVVETVDEDSKEYEKLGEYADKIGELDELLQMQVLSYSMMLDGSELDISDCNVTANIELTGEFREKAEESLPGAVAYLSKKDETDSKEAEPISYTTNNKEAKQQQKKSGVSVYGDEETDIEENIEIKDKTEIQFAAAELLEDTKINQVGNMVLNAENRNAAMSFSVKGRMLAIRSTETGVANPEFAVEYFAKLPRVVKSGGKGTTLSVINTSKGGTSSKSDGKGALPQNGKGLTATPNDNNLLNIYLNNKGVVQTQTTLTRVYATKTYEYKSAPSLMYFDCLTENAGYKLKELWVKYTNDPSKDEDGFAPSGIIPDSNGYYKYSSNPSQLHFTNRKVVAAEQQNYIYINQGVTIRLIYDTDGNDDNHFDSKMYDYAIASGKNAAGQWQTSQKAINQSGNYSGTGAKYAFGNANGGTNLDKQKWGANFINRYNRTSQGGNDSYQGCAFGLVTGVGKDGNVNFAGGINGLKIFGSNSLTGKAIYAGSDLNFKRNGDTYTLTSATVKKDGTTKSSVVNLDTFTKLTEKDNGSSDAFTIWSNNFWPFDKMTSELGDPKTGQKGQPVKHTSGNFPVSDNGIAHNNFFGMYYQVKFNLDKDYVGPLEYLFFGDDDMWVFLDGKLICDLGGVHSSVGEYVNLWDWLKQEDKGKEHTLQFFYTERGASGSSCWMQFTLPSVTSIPLRQNTGELEIAKQVSYEGSDPNFGSDDEFTFNIKLTDQNKSELLDDYAYTKFVGDKEIGHDIILRSGSDFTLKKGEKIVVKYLPVGTIYNITESKNVEYTPKYTIEKKTGTTYKPVGSEQEGGAVTGKITDKGEVFRINFNNVFIAYKLPETGGPGLIIYTMAGVLVILIGAGFMYRKKLGKGGSRVSSGN